MTYTDIYDISGASKCADFSPRQTMILKVLVGLLVVFFFILILSMSTYGFVNNTMNKLLKKTETQPTDVTNTVDASQSTEVPQPTDVIQPTEETQVVAVPEEPKNVPEGFISKDPFTNDLPYQLLNQSVSITPDTDYNELLQSMSLDSDVIKQHNQYVNDRNKITSTASFAPSRSDNQDIVTTWGLSKPRYIAIDPSARNIPSQDPEQGSKPVRLQWK